MKNKLVIVATVGLLAIAGCGGSGGSSTPSTPSTPVVTTVASANSFALQSAYKKLVANGSTVHYTVTDFCKGNASISSSAPVAATFEGVTTALSVTTTETATYTNCTPATEVITTITYYDSNYNPLGHSIAGTEYAVLSPAATPLPTSVKVGNTATIGSETAYADSTKTKTKTGLVNYSFVIEPETASTVIVNFITNNTNTQSPSQIQNRYRIDASGTLTSLLREEQYITSSNISAHIRYVAN